MLILYLHHGDKSPLIPEGSFLCGNFDYNYSSVYMATQHLVSVSLWGCYMQNSGKIKKKHFNTKIANMLIFIFNTLN